MVPYFTNWGTFPSHRRQRFRPRDPQAYEVEDSAFGMIRMKDGSTIHLEASWALNVRESKEASTTLCGTPAGAEINSGMSFKEDELIINRGRNGILMDERMAGGGNVAYFEGGTGDPGYAGGPAMAAGYPEWHTAAGASRAGIYCNTDPGGHLSFRRNRSRGPAERLGGGQMKLGFITSILDQYGYEQMIDTAAEMGFSCVEVACWPDGKAERRYAGVCHINVDRVLADDAYAAHLLSYSAEKNITISSLAFYPNTMDSDLEKRAANIAHLKNVIRASAKLKINMVSTFIGRDQTLPTEDNLELVKQLWPDIIRLAETLNVRIAIENCPMLFGREQWPGGQNLMCTPQLWRAVFDVLPSKYLGLNYDPSHFVWQMMDYISPLYEFRDRIFHVHFKDIKLYPEHLAQAGVLAYPLEYMQPKIPGLGDVDWGRFVSALTDIGYDGYACLEIEDRAFEGTPERVRASLRLSKRYIEQFVI